MTSKISYIKLIRADIRHRGWLAALTGIGLFLGMPVFALLDIDSRSGGTAVAVDGSAAADAKLYMLEQLRGRFPGFISGSAMQYLAAAIVICAVLCALTGFGYIHSKEKLDFYHALPVKRVQWFTVRYVSGLLIFLVPYVICSGLVVAVGGANGILNGEVAAESAMAMLGGILGFLLIYHTCILAASLTGQTVTGLLASLVIAVYPAVVAYMYPALQGTFFETYTGVGGDITTALAERLSPAGMFVRLTEASGAGMAGAGMFISAAVLAAVLLAGACILYRIYPSEAAGNALAFPRTAPVFKVMICIPAALFSGFIVKAFMGIAGTRWIVVLSLLAAVLLCVLIEFIYQQDMRMLLKGWVSSVVSVAGVLIILCIFSLDLFGYDTWMPDEKKVSSIAFDPASFDVYFEYPEYYAQGGSPAVLSGGSSSDEEKEVLYRLAQTGVENLRGGMTPGELDLADSDSEIAEEYVNTVFRYQMGGREVYRRYCLGREDLREALDELGKSEEFRKGIFPVFHVDSSNVESVSYRDLYGIPASAELSGEQIGKLLDAYKKDVLAADMDVFIDGDPLGEIILDIPQGAGDEIRDTVDAADADWQWGIAGENGTVSVGSFYVYGSFANTLECMEGFGYTFRTEIAPEDVTAVDLHFSGESMRSGRYKELLSALPQDVERISYEDGAEDITLWSPEDIRAVLGSLEPYNAGLLGSQRWTGDYADIQFGEGVSSYSYEIREVP